MKQPASRTLYNYWNGLRLSRQAPLRSDVNPREIKTLLPRLFILERETETCYRYRLAGTELCGFYGVELRGTNFLDSWKENELRSIQSLFASIMDDKTAAILGVKASENEYNQCLMEFLLLPVRLDGTDEIRILGSVGVFDEPAWLSRNPVRNQEVTSLRLMWPDNASKFLENTPDVDPSGPTQVPVDTPPRVSEEGRQRRAHLRIIEGGVP